MLLYNILWNVFIYFPRRRNFAYDGPVRGYPAVPDTAGDRCGCSGGRQKESEGPLAAEFDELSADNRFGQSSWEAAENTCSCAPRGCACKRRRFRRKRCSWPLPGICRPSAQHPAMPCGSWACPLPGCSGPAAPWPRALRWALLCARAVLRAICWPWLPATSARQSGSSARR